MKFICSRKSKVHLIFRVTKRPWKTISDDAFYTTLSLSLSRSLCFFLYFPPSLSLFFFFMTFLFLYPFNIQGKIEGISISIVQKKYRARIIFNNVCWRAETTHSHLQISFALLSDQFRIQAKWQKMSIANFSKIYFIFMFWHFLEIFKAPVVAKLRLSGIATFKI